MKKLIDYTLFQIGDFDFKVIGIIKLIVFIFVVLLLLKIIRKTIYRVDKIDMAKK
jgi:hypothetical protein